MDRLIQWININQGTVMVLLTLSYVVITVFLFFSNRKIRKQSLMLELLNRRVEIYTVARKLISSVILAADCTNEQLQQYLRDTREAKLLFKKDVVDYVDEIYKKGLHLIAVRNRLDACKGDRGKILDEQEEILDWFEKQIKNPASVFDKYIDINKMHF